MVEEEILYMSVLKPLPNFILAEPIQDELESGGVYLPETVKDKPAKAKVIAIGDDPRVDMKLLPDETFGKLLKIGQIIIHKRWTPTTIKDRGKDVVFIPFEDILGYYE